MHLGWQEPRPWRACLAFGGAGLTLWWFLLLCPLNMRTQPGCQEPMESRLLGPGLTLWSLCLSLNVRTQPGCQEPMESRLLGPGLTLWSLCLSLNV